MTYVAISIGVPEESAARDLSRTLVEKRLVAGTRITSGPSHYRWDGEVRERTYWTIVAFTTADNVEAVRNPVERRHSDDLPGLTYTEIDASDDYLRWIDAGTR